MLKKFNVTIRRFDPSKGPQDAGAEEFILPVDSPDEEHAIASTMSNAISFSTKTKGSEVLPVAFTCVHIEQRNS